MRHVAAEVARLARKARHIKGIPDERRDEIVAMLLVVASTLFLEAADQGAADPLIAFTQRLAFLYLGRSGLSQLFEDIDPEAVIKYIQN